MNKGMAIFGLFSFLTFLALLILSLLGQALDKSFENDDARIRQHKAQIYISATDQALIDWTKQSNESK